MRLSLTLHIALTIVVFSASTSANAQKMPDVRGFYAGYSGEINPAGAVEPEDIGPAELAVTFQNGRRFGGFIGRTDGQIIQYDGTFSAQGVVNIVGKVRENATFVAHGKVREVGGGSPDPGGLALMYEINGPGVHVRGILIGMRMFGGADWNMAAGADVTGPYTGELRSGAGPSCMPAAAFLQNLKGTTGVTRDLGISGSPLTQDGSVRFDLRGSIAAVPPDPCEYPIRLLGVDANTGIVGILTGIAEFDSDPQQFPTDPCGITGEYRLYASFFDVFFDIYHGVDMSVDRGMFELLPYIAPPPSDLP